MTILISNDDGIHAPGIAALTEKLQDLAPILTVAPDRNCSGASNSLTLENPLRIMSLSEQRYAVKGTPTDCVHLAINELISGDPEFVVAGINAGANLGDDVLYSGTVAAAMEGRHLGTPAIAISLAGEKLIHYKSAATIAADIIQNLRVQPLAGKQILNINVPDLPLDEIKGIKVTRLGCRHRSEKMLKQQDPRGHQVYWLGPPGNKQDAGEGTDFHAVAEGYVSITPISVDMTAFSQLTPLQQWLNSWENA